MHFAFQLILILVGICSQSLAESETTFSCKDCHTALVRSKNKLGKTSNVVAEVRCPPESPYCSESSGSCTNKQELRCGRKDESFICEDDGVYLDDNCSAYHVCTAGNPLRFVCENNTVYNPDDGTCETNGKCGTFHCQEGAGATAHSVYPRYYSMCTGDHSMIRKCPNEYTFNDVIMKKCIPTCLEEGTFKDLEDCQYYFECQKHWNNGIPQIDRSRKACSYPSVYDPKSRMCRYHPDQTNENCKASPIHKVLPLIYPPPFNDIRRHADVVDAILGNLICVEEGLFPTDDCHEVLRCGKKSEYEMYRCRNDNIYDPHAQQCTENGKCGNFDCKRSGEKAVHSVDPTYYAYCDEHLKIRTISRCPTPFEMNVTSQSCELFCHGEGVSKDPYNCTRYISCEKEWLTPTVSVLKRKYFSCPKGQGFDEDNKQCAQLPSCQTP